MIFYEDKGHSHRQCDIGDIWVGADGKGNIKAYERTGPAWHWDEVPIPISDQDLDYVRQSLGLANDVTL